MPHHIVYFHLSSSRTPIYFDCSTLLFCLPLVQLDNCVCLAYNNCNCSVERFFSLFSLTGSVSQKMGQVGSGFDRTKKSVELRGKEISEIYVVTRMTQVKEGWLNWSREEKGNHWEVKKRGCCSLAHLNWRWASWYISGSCSIVIFILMSHCFSKIY